MSEASSFAHFCTCGGYAHTMNGRDPRRPHMSWCPQREEYNEWYDRTHGTMSDGLQRAVEAIIHLHRDFAKTRVEEITLAAGIPDELTPLLNEMIRYARSHQSITKSVHHTQTYRSHGRVDRADDMISVELRMPVSEWKKFLSHEQSHANTRQSHE